MSDIDGRSRMDNRYYRVAQPFPLEVRVGLHQSNVWIGRIRALEIAYQTVTVRPGDELHLLVGGHFFLRNGQPFEFDTRRKAASEIMLHPAPPDPVLPLTALREIDREQAQRPASYRANSPGWAERRPVPV